MNSPRKLRDIAEHYLTKHGVSANIEESLGHATDGAAWATSRGTAVKPLLSALETFQIYYLDPKPQNIDFPRT